MNERKDRIGRPSGFAAEQGQTSGPNPKIHGQLTVDNPRHSSRIGLQALSTPRSHARRLSGRHYQARHICRLPYWPGSGYQSSSWPASMGTYVESLRSPHPSGETRCGRVIQSGSADPRREWQVPIARAPQGRATRLSSSLCVRLVRARHSIRPHRQQGCDWNRPDRFEGSLLLDRQVYGGGMLKGSAGCRHRNRIRLRGLVEESSAPATADGYGHAEGCQRNQEKGAVPSSAARAADAVQRDQNAEKQRGRRGKRPNGARCSA